MAAKFRNAGQTCVCANTLYVQARVAEAFTAKLVARVRALKVGDGLVPGTSIGPLISPAAVRAQAALVADAVAGGARIAVGGAAVHVGGGGGNFFAPTVLTGLPLPTSASAQACRVIGEEIFGPLAPIVAFEGEAEVLRAANASRSGLAAYVYTGGSARAWRVGAALRVGMVGVNTGMISAAQAPFGGVKESGFGREGGRAGLLEYQNIKYTMMGF